jgi:TRAP-type C4-dicarboxylate transport system permease small subunit
VQALVERAGPRARVVLRRLVDLAMVLTALFMLVWGLQLVRTTWHQVIAEFPVLSVGLTYLPLPAGGLLTLLFIVERLWVGEPPVTSVMYRDRAEALE